ncbi:mucin-2 [Drosophila subpulchrella]|uniref:mucin-2 n=1 Tax=Drosophila subpulchrella TaxID=1486046 RepID=UPI0018A17E1C|nr:mucin-2 [Drosophila subpulchrella]
MIGERHKSRDLVTILGLFHLLQLLLLHGSAAGHVIEVLAQSTTASKSEPQTLETKTNGSQDGAGLTPGATTAQRLDPNNNNEWRPLGHGDPLQKDPTYDYSPPALERVRYWAENNSTGQSNPEARKKELPPEVLRNKTKSEVLLLGVASERVRVPHSHSYPPVGLTHNQQHQQQQQAKYAAIRRSYYAPTQQQHGPQTQHMPSHFNAQQHMPPTHLMPPPMMMIKSSGAPPHLEYRHSMMATGAPTSYMSLNHMSSPTPKSPMTSSVIYHQPMGHHTSLSSSTPWMTSMPPHRLSYSDPHLQESMHTYSFSRPHHHQQSMMSYSPNSLPGLQSGSKTGLRKPWLHELLQKEVVVTSKPKVKPTMPATKYLMGTSKPHHPLPPMGMGISSTRPPFTYAPVTFVPGPPTIAVPTVATRQELQPEIYISPTPQTSNPGFRPMLMTSTTTVGTTPSTTTPIYHRTSTTTTSNRLLIPQTSNLAQRPTVAPAPSEPTTDSLFSHYKQPPKPLMGPMYLIIEGHSKVKTYGQNELDPHSPKIVPVISKREPVVRIADPNEKRGTVESYQVKHLHTKTTPMTTTTTKTTTTSKPTTTRAPQKAPVYSTTKAPVSTTPKITKPPTIKTTKATTTKVPISSTTPLVPKQPNPEPPSGVNDLLSLLDNMFADAHEIASSTGSPLVASSTTSTVLKPVSTKLMPQQPEPRISSKAGSIDSLLEDDEAGEDLGSANSTATPPRSTRQIFDYDQLPESRIKVGVTTSDILEYNDDDDGEEELEEDDQTTDGQIGNQENDEEEEADESHNLLKRIDQFVDDVDDGDDDLEDLIEGLDEDEIDERRQQH